MFRIGIEHGRRNVPLACRLATPGLRGFHPSGSRIQNRCCDTVVFVRVGEDAYLDYALRGGS